MSYFFRLWEGAADFWKEILHFVMMNFNDNTVVDGNHGYKSRSFNKKLVQYIDVVYSLFGSVWFQHRSFVSFRRSDDKDKYTM